MVSTSDKVHTHTHRKEGDVRWALNSFPPNTNGVSVPTLFRAFVLKITERNIFIKLRMFGLADI